MLRWAIIWNLNFEKIFRYEVAFIVNEGCVSPIKQEICPIPADIQRSGRFWCPACRLYVQLRASDQSLSRRPPTLIWPPARTNDDRNAPDLGLVYLCWPACPRRSGAWFTAHPATWGHGGGGGGAIPRARLTQFSMLAITNTVTTASNLFIMLLNELSRQQ